MDASTVILIINSLFYITAFVMYQIRMRTFQMGSFILLFYSLLSVGSVWLYNIDSRPLKYPFPANSQYING